MELSLSHSDVVMKEMIAILGRLKLQRIQLTISGMISWESFPMAFRTAFVACISSSSMKEINLDRIYDTPLSIFADCVGLKRLRLTLWYRVVPPSNRLFKFPHLETL